MIGSLLSEAPLWALLLLQSTACIAAGLTASYLLRRCPARAHHALMIALVASILTPAAYLLARHFDLGLLPYQPPALQQAEGSIPVFVETTFVDESTPHRFDFEPVTTALVPPTTIPAAVADPEATPIAWTTIGFACWAACSAALLARLLLQFVLGLRLLHTSEPVHDAAIRSALRIAQARLEVRQPVAIARHARVHSPVIWCWSRPPVLLLHHADPALRDHTDWIAVFCHELAHLKRRDHHSGLFAELLTAAIPWHPFVWWARTRLARLSEHACDDWVLAAGQPATDYAESLLHLSPQRRVAFLPTVVGKERTMKARIYRIVKDQHGDPRISRRWTLVLTGLLILATTAVALAQREPAPSDPMVQGDRDEAPRPMRQTALTGRRNVLQRLLDQLVAQVEETERALQQRGDEPDEQTEILRAELRTLHDQIGAIERQLDTLNRRGRPVPPQPPLLEQQRQRRGADLLQELRRRQERIQSRLAEIDDPDREESRELREQLARLDVEMRQVEARARAESARSQAQVRQAEGRARARREATSRVPQQERPGREPDDRVRDLRNRVLELDRQMADMSRSLAQSDDPDSEESRNRRATLEQSERERADVREELERLDPNFDVWELERGLRLNEEFAGEIARQIAGMERGLLDLEQQGRGDTAEAAELRRNLARLHAQVRTLEAEIEARRRLLSRVRSERDPDERRTGRRATSSSRIDPYGDPYARGTTRARVSSPQVSPDVHRQVEELRGQVNGLNQQIQQMREMLQQLLERRDQPAPGPQQMKPY